jgi:hypothetical protein
MRRTTLGLVSLAAAAAACAATWYALREATPVAVQAHAPELVAAAGAPDAAAAPAPPQPPAPGDAQRLLLAARAAEAQEEALRDAIVRIGDDDSVSLDARLERFQEAVDAARDGAPAAPIFTNPSLLAEVFLRMEGVQRELAAQSPAARSEEIARIRRELGFGEEQVARMREIDDRREARWQNGLQYMEERARVAATFEGEAREEELAHLRARYFEEEAPTIEREEAGGFFRFERPRVFGRN